MDPLLGASTHPGARTVAAPRTIRRRRRLRTFDFCVMDELLYRMSSRFFKRGMDETRPFVGTSLVPLGWVRVSTKGSLELAWAPSLGSHHTNLFGLMHLQVCPTVHPRKRQQQSLPRQGRSPPTSSTETLIPWKLPAQAGEPFVLRRWRPEPWKDPRRMRGRAVCLSA